MPAACLPSLYNLAHILFPGVVTSSLKCLQIYAHPLKPIQAALSSGCHLHPIKRSNLLLCPGTTLTELFYLYDIVTKVCIFPCASLVTKKSAFRVSNQGLWSTFSEKTIRNWIPILLKTIARVQFYNWCPCLFLPHTM
jgi:hypothetical protein